MVAKTIRVIFLSILFIYIGMILFYYVAVNIIVFNPFYWFSDDKSPTPEEYKYNKTVLDSTYTSDSRIIADLLAGYVSKNEYSFSSDIFDSETEVFIDTIVYDVKGDRMAVLTISKVPNEKLGSMPPSVRKNHPPKGFTYYGFCYLAVRTDKGIVLRWLNIIQLINSESFISTRNDIRTHYFFKLAYFQRKGEKMRNIDDKRFWGLSLWWELFFDVDK